jgi:hypothetical protein
MSAFAQVKTGLDIAGAGWPGPAIASVSVNPIAGDLPGGGASTRVGKLAWRQPPFEYEYEKLPIDILSGSDTMRRRLEQGAGLDVIEAA